MAKPKKDLFVPLSVGVPRDPRFCRLLSLPRGEGAYVLWSFAAIEAKERLSDGRFPAVSVRRLHPYANDAEQLAQLLVDVGLWRRDGEDFVIVGWTDWNDTREVVETKQLAKRGSWQKQKADQRARAAADQEPPSDPHHPGGPSSSDGQPADPGNVRVVSAADIGRTEATSGADTRDVRGSSSKTPPPTRADTGDVRSESDGSAPKSAADLGRVRVVSEAQQAGVRAMSAPCPSRATEIRDQRSSTTTSTPPAGASEEARGALSVDEASILAELGRHPSLIEATYPEVAETIASRLLGSGKTLPDICRAIKACAEHTRMGGEQLNRSALSKKLLNYVDREQHQPAGGPPPSSGAPSSGGRGGPRSGWRPIDEDAPLVRQRLSKDDLEAMRETHPDLFNADGTLKETA